MIFRIASFLTIRRTRGWVLGSLIVFGLGCALASPQSQLLPPAHFVGARTPKHESAVKLFREGEMPGRPWIRIAAVAAHGNGYADRETLEGTLIEEAATLGADLVLVTASEVTKDETIGTYGSGVMMANQIQRPHLYGVACRWATARIGATWDDKDGVVQYVEQGSAAQKAGIREGHRILALNGKFIRSDPYVVEREILTKRAGEKVRVEFLGLDGRKWFAQVPLQAAE
jgi:membrane-associated protease RseP (regulator of RpoE activity)